MNGQTQGAPLAWPFIALPLIGGVGVDGFEPPTSAL